MTEQEKARTRNWNKARLMGITINSSILTDIEKLIAHQILQLRDRLIENWDENSEEFLGHSLKPFKCVWCGKRSNKEYIVDGDNYCYKHFKSQLEAL